MKDKIVLLILRIGSDDDFYWNSKSYPREKNSWGDYEDKIRIYFKNPTNKEIADVIQTIANEFKESFSTSREYVFSVKEEIYDALVSSVYLSDNDAEVYDRYILEYDSGNYSASLTLVDYEEKEITFTNTEETLKIGSFEYCE